MLNAARGLGDLRAPPGNRLEALKGDLRGKHSIRINAQWRIVFRWESGDAYDVDASVVATAERLHVPQLATRDARHFTVVSPTHASAFEILP